MRTIFKAFSSQRSVADFANFEDVFIRDLTTNSLKSRFKKLHRMLWKASSEADVAYLKHLISEVRDELEHRVVIQPSESFEDYAVRAHRAGKKLRRSPQSLRESPLLEIPDSVDGLQSAYLRLYDLLWNAGQFSSERFVHTSTSMFYEAYQLRKQLVEVHGLLVSHDVSMVSY